MKNHLSSILLFLLFLIVGCSKKKQNIRLAKNYYQQCLLEIEDKNFQKALQLIDKSIESSSTPQSLALKATLFYQIKQFSESLPIFKKILKEKDASPTLKADVTNNLACNYLALGQKEEAKKLWSQLTYDPHYFSPEVAWFNLGLIEFNEAVQENKNEPEAFKRKIKEAQKFFSKALAVSTEYVDAYFYLAYTYMHLKEYKKAEQVITSLLNLSPKHEQAKDLIALINKKRDEQEKAELS